MKCQIFQRSVCFNGPNSKDGDAYLKVINKAKATSSSTLLATRVLNAARPSESGEFLEPRTPGSLLIGQAARALLLIGREI